MEQQNHALYRLNSLIGAGFKLDDAGLLDTCSLSHPSYKFRYRHAYVYADGMTAMPYSDEDEKRFYAEDDNREFDAFIATVPKPTFWERLPPDELTAWIWGIGLGALLMHVHLR